MPISEVHNMDCMEYMKDIPDAKTDKTLRLFIGKIG